MSMMPPAGRGSGARGGGACAARTGACGCTCIGVTGAGWSGRMPFTSGSGRAITFSWPFVGRPTGSSSGTVTIS
jgi:hypothetical protein